MGIHIFSPHFKKWLFVLTFAIARNFADDKKHLPTKK